MNIGTIIRATHRAEDLVPAFVSVLEDRIDEAPLEMAKGEELDMVARIKTATLLLANIEGVQREMGEEYFGSEECSFDLECLFNALDSLAPIGTYFGAHEGDGSDFGFWEDEGDDVR